MMTKKTLRMIIIGLRLLYSLMVWMYKSTMPFRGNTKESMEKLTVPMELFMDKVLMPMESMEELTMPGEEPTMSREVW